MPPRVPISCTCSCSASSSSRALPVSRLAKLVFSFRQRTTAKCWDLQTRHEGSPRVGEDFPTNISLGEGCEIRHGGSAVGPIWPFGELSRRVNSPAPARTSDLRAGKLEKWPTGSSQAVPHPSTIPARRCLTSVIGRERVLSSRYEATRRGLISRATHGVPKLRTLWQTSERSELPSAAVLSLAGPSAGSSRSSREPEESSREIAVLTPARPFLGPDGLPAAVPGSGKVNPGPRCLFEGCRNFVRPLVAVTARGKAEVRCARSIARGGSCRARESSGRPVRTGRGCGGTLGRGNKSAGPFGGLRTSAVSRTSGRGDLGRKRHFWQFLEPGRAPEGPPGDRTDRR